MRFVALMAALLCCAAFASDPVQSDIAVLLHTEGTPAVEAAARLARKGPRALAPIEAALPGASASGRKNLILALRKLGDGAAVPRLQQLALSDPAPDVRREALWTLKVWAAGTHARNVQPTPGARTPAEIEARATQARSALRAIEEAHHREERG